ncbi:MAG: hypothetical protein QM655_07950 [Nocardioidaceae bacterium]
MAASGGGKVIVVDADNKRGLEFYRRNDFKKVATGDSLTLCLKVSTARSALHTE